MTHLTPEEDFAMCSPEMIEADLRHAEDDAVWKPCAEKLGWFWSPAFDGFINRGDRTNDDGGIDPHRIHTTAEDACFADGVETIEEALEVLDR